ncbi:unnamed protein product [Protopolystoma xenopodis]|uniref:Uncharacterized protein n=1 Tax=Protopolystoma xenopodis TaxID=117903 RepID=A0A448XCQ2_9PLAT|nr:unnamed protein product [Protopolystoma xenopodis]
MPHAPPSLSFSVLYTSSPCSSLLTNPTSSPSSFKLSPFLTEEIRALAQLEDLIGLNVDLLLVTFPIFLGVILTYVVGMTTTWAVGASVGSVGIFLQALSLSESE